ncbi:hypothetical protein JOF53_005232 [Crossiella equi]|uniref:Secreted protein n=1 Tax=Crossiella equi TaxID=130796 RepID=A0ABS5AIF5_9PSEU|nr:hypothetical protein [Crossiella equi]MBP2476360.1 hypothetical protein [Crossiella equi]
MSRAVRSSGVLPLVAAVSTAVALTGAAVFTVVRVGCQDPAEYKTHNGVVELIGGCVEKDDLPVGPPQTTAPVKPQEQEPAGV